MKKLKKLQILLWLPEAAQSQHIGDSTAAMGLLPQGPQKQRHGQQLRGARYANQDEGGHRHDTERPFQRQQLPMRETAESQK